MDTASYKGFYKDENSTIPIIVEEDSYGLAAVINELRFTSDNLDKWELDQTNEFDEEKLDGLSIASVTIREGYNLVTKYMLQNCTLSFDIPQKELDKQVATELEGYLQIELELKGESPIINLKLKLPNDGDVEIKDAKTFENGLKEINKRINKNYILFNCFNCRYSSYSVYGGSVFGSLLCYKKYKKAFLQVTDKQSYEHTEKQGHDIVRETDYCEEFQLPDRNQFLYK